MLDEAHNLDPKYFAHLKTKSEVSLLTVILLVFWLTTLILGFHARTLVFPVLSQELAVHVAYCGIGLENEAMFESRLGCVEKLSLKCNDHK